MRTTDLTELEDMASRWEKVEHMSGSLAAAHCAAELRAFLSRHAPTDPAPPPSERPTLADIKVSP